jgi:hypothetical protein
MESFQNKENAAPSAKPMTSSKSKSIPARTDLTDSKFKVVAGEISKIAKAP